MLEIQGITAQNPHTAMFRATAAFDIWVMHGGSAPLARFSSMLAMR
jgi:hypothetical protein